MSIRPQNELRHNHLAAVLLAAVLVLPALFWGPQHPQFVHLALLGLVVEVLLLVWLLRRELPLRGIRSFLSSGANPYLLAYLGWSAASLAYGLDRRAAEAGCLQLAFGVLLYAIIALEFRERAQIRRLLGALLALAVGPVVWSYFLAPDARWQDFGGRFRDWQLFGGYLGLLAPVLLGISLGVSTRLARWLTHIGLGIVLIGLVMTRCRSAWIGALAAVLLFGWLYLRFTQSAPDGRERRRRLAATLAGLALVLGLFVSLARGGAPIRERAASLGSLTGQVLSGKAVLATAEAGAAATPDRLLDRGLGDRLVIWSDALHVFAEKPLIGWGLGSYPRAQARLGLGPRAEALIQSSGPSLGDMAHNAYLQIAAEQGILGLACYLLVLVAFFRTTLLALPGLADPLRRTVVLGCQAAIAGQAVDGLANPGWTYPELTTLFWVVLGTGIAAASPPLALPLPKLNPAADSPEDAPVFGLPGFVYRAIRTTVVGSAALWIGSQLVTLGTGLSLGRAGMNPGSGATANCR